MAHLLSLIHVSTAARRLAVAELDRLMTRAQERNVREDITGVLLYHDGDFMQYLEGPAAGIERVDALIRAEPLHHGIIELLREPIAKREFAEWSMAFRAVDGTGLSIATAQEALLLAKLAPPPIPVPAARVLLSNFCNQGLQPSR